MRFAFILFTFCLWGCGGDGGSVNVPEAAFSNQSSTSLPTTIVYNTDSGNTTTNTSTTTTTNTNSGNTTATDNSINDSYNNYTGGQ